MFIDEVNLNVVSGKGGDGCLSFRREKYVPRGGPDGGNGGRGGSVIFKADNNVSSLLELRRIQVYTARVGQPGGGNNRSGPAGEDRVILVPIGTIIRDRNTGEIIVDLVEDQQEAVVAQGGKGGRGNKSFASSTHQTPREFTYGDPAEELELALELKLIADVGLVGLPNAGKSTILARLSAATPKIASYPFTTLKPQLGIVSVDRYAAFVMADIPGLIEGAHTGAGLGHEFLRHIERTRVLAHIVDLVPFDDTTPVENVKIINAELLRFSEDLAIRPMLIVGNKADLPGAEEAALELEEAFGKPVIRISALTGKNLDHLKTQLYKLVVEEKRL